MSSDPTSDTLPSLSRSGSLYQKRGTSVTTLQIADPVQPSSDVLPVNGDSVGAGESSPVVGSKSASEAEGGEITSALSDLQAADFKQQPPSQSATSSNETQ